MGEVIHVDFSMNPKKIEKAARKILSLEDLRRDYDDEGILKMAEDDMSKTMRRLGPRERMEAPKKAEEMADIREQANKRYTQGMEE